MGDEYLEDYYSFLRFPSVSTDEKYAGKVRDCAQWLSEKLAKIGLESKVVPTAGHPIVWARNEHKKNRPTVLLYGHYDVQPPDPLDLWESPPFEPTVRDGKLYARGAADDKGNMFAPLKAIEALVATQGRVPIGLKCLFEGEEEVGSPSLPGFVRDN